MGRLAPVVANTGPTPKDTGVTSFELLNAEAERLLVCHGRTVKQVVRYRRGEEILYLDATNRPMTAWIWLDDKGDEKIATEGGWPIERTKRSIPWARIR
jgi:hypothetical protein